MWWTLTALLVSVLIGQCTQLYAYMPLVSTEYWVVHYCCHVEWSADFGDLCTLFKPVIDNAFYVDTQETVTFRRRSRYKLWRVAGKRVLDKWMNVISVHTDWLYLPFCLMLFSVRVYCVFFCWFCVLCYLSIYYIGDCRACDFQTLVHSGLTKTWLDRWDRRDSENGPSACPVSSKLGKSCWRGTNAAVTSFRSCWRFCASSSLRFASLTMHDLVHQTADKNCCVLPYKVFECVI